MTTITHPVDSSNLDATRCDTKERLFDMLAQACDEHGRMDKIAYCEQSDKVLFVLDTCQGMFNEAGYAYKMREIAQRIADQCFEFLGHCAHAQTIKRVEITRNRALMLVQRFYTLHQAKMDPINPDRIMSMTNIELAS